MKKMFKEIMEELRSVFSNKTFDTLLPPLVFVIVSAFYTLLMAGLVAISLAVLILIYRLVRRKTWAYAVSGLFVVMIASSFAYLAGNATNYFLPGIISSAVLLMIAIVSLVIKKPLAAWASHLTRGWALPWFWRDDVKPAYQEVTLMWSVFIFIRLVIQVILFIEQDAVQLFWVNTLLGLPLTIVVLILSYVYGIARLRRLKGPGIEEYLRGDTPPYKGQTRGF